MYSSDLDFGSVSLYLNWLLISLGIYTQASCDALSSLIRLLQGTLLRYLPPMLFQFTKLLSMADLGQIMVKLINAVPKVPDPEVDRMKLKFMKNIATSTFFLSNGNYATVSEVISAPHSRRGMCMYSCC